MIHHTSITELRDISSITPEDISIQQWLANLGDFIDSLTPVTQELQINLAPDLFEEEVLDATETSVPTGTIVEVTSEAMEVDDDFQHSAFDVMIKVLLNAL